MTAPTIVGQPRDPSVPTVGPSDTSAAAGQLNRLVARGVSGGFDGILYENRDRAHSILPEELFPNLTFLKYDQELLAKRMDYGLAGRILIPALVFGNSSTAVTAGAQPRSLARLAMTSEGGAARGYRDYRANSIYIYPEHKDYDELDLFPASWPYAIVSQGSSFSDAPFMRAVAMTLAAFPAETRTALEASGLIAPTVQMILRRNLTLVRTRDHYLSAAAHPPVFSYRWLQVGRMVGHAASLRPEDVPPVVQLKVIEEDFERSAGLAKMDEHLFTTPSAMARIWRGFQWEREMVISAAATEDPNGRELQFEWVVLRGDVDRIQIEPLEPNGITARIRIKWHPAIVVPPREPKHDIARKSSRVDIGVFAWNGKSDSAPALISFSFPGHQSRNYETGADGKKRLASIDYDALRRGARYDPALHWSAPWVDNFEYDPAGQLMGWDRTQAGATESFDARGRNADGKEPQYSITDTEGFPVLGRLTSETEVSK